MAGSSIGTVIRATTFGESHGAALGVILDGFPSGIALSESDIQPYLDRRKPGQSQITTPRKEADQAEILSGVFEGVTTGTPIMILIRNTSQRSSDYNNVAHTFRPGHADYTYSAKYGVRDYRGGGRSSGRETAARVAAGAVCMKLLRSLGIEITAYTRSIGPVEIRADGPRSEWFDKDAILTTKTAMPDREKDAEALKFLESCMQQKDSAGGVIECCISHVPAGLGEPVFNKLDAQLAGAVMSIGAVKAVEIGDGIKVPSSRGSENNDAFRSGSPGVKNKDANYLGAVKTSNHAGGMLGGISDGSDILLRAHVKPTPSIFREQETVTDAGENTTLLLSGRHDPVIVPRAVVVVEAMCALVIADALALNMTSTIESYRKLYPGRQ